MGRTIICNNCKSTFDENVLSQRDNSNVCPVCNVSLLGKNEEDFSDTQKEKTKWYYYESGGGGLIDFEDEDDIPLYTFDAVDAEDAKRQLKEVLPNSSLFRTNSDSQVRCPYCQSKEVQLVPKKFSLLTGFTSNKYQRMCVRCKRKF